MFKLSVRDLRAHVGRYVLTFIAVAIGVAFVGGVLTLTDTINQSFEDLFADVTEGTDAWVQGEEQFSLGAQFGGGSMRPRIDESLTDIILDVDGVADVGPFVQGYTRAIDKQGEPIGNPSFGPPTFGASWDEVDELSPWNLLEGGRGPTASDEVVIDKATADAGDFAVGDTIQYQTQQGTGEATVVGITRFGTQDSPLGASFVLFDLATAEELLAEPGRVDGIGIVARDGISQEQVRDRVAAALAEAGEDDNVEVITGEALAQQNEDATEEAFSFFTILLLVFAGIAVAVGIFVIYTSFSFIVAQRQRQVALLRAVGAARRQIMTSVLLESVVVGLLASVAGYVLGAGLAVLLSSFMLDDGQALVILPVSVIIALAVGIVVTVLSATIPAWRGTRVPPVAVLRDVELDRAHRPEVRLSIGGGLLAVGVTALVAGARGAGLDLGIIELSGVGLAGIGMALVFIALVVLGPLVARPAALTIGWPLPKIRGVIGRLAQRNAARNPRRTSSTASAVMIAMGIVALFLVLNASVQASVDDLVDNRFTGDYVVDSGAGFTGAGLPPTASDELNDLDEVNAAAAIRFGFAEIDGNAEPLSGVDPARAFDLFDIGVAAGDIADLGADEVAVFDERAEDEGWQVGDTLPVTFAETGTQDLTIVALMETQDLLGPFVFDTTVFDQNIPTSGDFQIWVQLADGVSVDEARPELAAIVDQFPTAELWDTDEFKAATRQQFTPILALFGVMIALTVVVAMIGIVNTLVLSVIERTREIGLTRAVGGMRRQIRAAIRWEALLIAGFGLVAAVGTGTFFGWVIVRSLEDLGFSAFEIPPGALISLIILTAVLTLLGAVVPAAWAGRRPILSAIATE